MDNIKPQKTLAVKEMAAQYRDTTKLAGNRSSYLKTPGGTHLLHWKYRGDTTFITILNSLFGMVLGFTIARYIASGFGMVELGYMVILFVILGFHVRNMKKRKKLHRKAHAFLKDYARYYEPESLWELEYPIQGEKGELITAILSARRLSRMVESSTTLPIGSESKEPYYSHLIKTIIDAPESDISPYIYHEVNHLCDTIKDYMTEYSAIISLNAELRKMHEKPNQ